MKIFYSMILLMAFVGVNASEKKLKARLEREYDLQLVQKQKEIESRKLLQSVAKKQKSKIRDDQEKSIESNKRLEIKQQKKWQRKEEACFRQEKERWYRQWLYGTLMPSVFVLAVSQCLFFRIAEMYDLRVLQ